MKIRMSPTPERKDTFTFFIEDEPWKNIHMAVFGRWPKFPSEIEDMSKWQVFFNAMEYRQGKNYVLRRLSQQSYYSKQLEKLLKERLLQASTIQRLIQETSAWGYINDEAWLDAFMRGHVKRHSMRAIARKLQLKGVPPPVLEELIEKWRNPSEEMQRIQHLIQTRYRSKNLADYKERQKVIAALLRKGYPYELVQSVLNKKSVCSFEEEEL